MSLGIAARRVCSLRRPLCAAAAHVATTASATTTTTLCAMTVVAVHTQRRCVFSGTGRGDLHYVNVLSGRTASRKYGMMPGVKHYGQATLPMCGQLHVRKSIIHATHLAVNERNDMLAPDTATWAHLLPSLRRCAETLVPDTLWRRLCGDADNDNNNNNENKKSDKGNNDACLSSCEMQTLADAQQLFAYELHQRITLLEDSIADATLHHLVEWPVVFRRAWLLLPLPRDIVADMNSHSHGTCDALCHCDGGHVRGTHIEALMPFRRHSTGGRAVVTYEQQQQQQTTDGVAVRDARDVRPTSNQVYDLAARVRRLTRRVAARVREELLSRHGNSDADAALSPRERAHFAQLRDAWDESMAWHAAAAVDGRNVAHDENVQDSSHMTDMSKRGGEADTTRSLQPVAAAAAAPSAAAVTTASFVNGHPFMSRDKRKRFIQLLLGGIVVVLVLIALTAVVIGGVVKTLREMRAGAQLATPVDRYTAFLHTLQSELDAYLPLQLTTTSAVSRQTRVTAAATAAKTDAALSAFADAVAMPRAEVQQMTSALAELRRMSVTDTANNNNVATATAAAAAAAAATATLTSARDAALGDAMNAYLLLINFATSAVLQRVRDGATRWFGQTVDVLLTDSHAVSVHALASYVAALHTVKQSSKGGGGGGGQATLATTTKTTKTAAAAKDDAQGVEVVRAVDNTLAAEQAEMLATLVNTLGASLALDQQLTQQVQLEQQRVQQQQQQTQQQAPTDVIDPDVHHRAVQYMTAVLLNATQLLHSTVGFVVPSSPEKQLLPYNDTDDLATLARVLATHFDTRAVVSLQNTIYQLICFSVACLLLCLTLAVNALLLRRHWRQLRPIRRLIAAFEDAKAAARRRPRYLAVLQELRAVALPRSAASVTEREYLVAAHFLDTLRVAVPQLLYGHPHNVYSALANNNSSSSTSGTDGGGAHAADDGDSGANANVVLRSKVRLEQGRWHCPATVLMEVALTGLPTIVAADALSCGFCSGSISSSNGAAAATASRGTRTRGGHNSHNNDGTSSGGGRQAAEKHAATLTAHMALLSAAYSIIVDEVNDAGGVVLGVHDGLHVLAVWNATAPTRHAALAACRTGSIVHTRLRAALPELTAVAVSVTCGHSVLSNGPLASRMAAVLTSTAFANIVKLRTVHSSLRVPLLLDGDTHRALPFRARDACKPVVLMRSACVAETLSMVVYAMDVCGGDAAATAAEAQAQRALYDAGFFLYQNSMIAQAVAQLQRYVLLYPRDTTAQWLLTHILLPRQLAVAKASSSATTAAEAAAEGDAGGGVGGGDAGDMYMI